MHKKAFAKLFGSPLIKQGLLIVILTQQKMRLYLQGRKLSLYIYNGKEGESLDEICYRVFCEKYQRVQFSVEPSKLTKHNSYSVSQFACLSTMTNLARYS